MTSDPQQTQPPTQPEPRHAEGSVPTPASASPAQQAASAVGGFFRELGPAAVLGVLWGALPALGGFVLLGNLGRVSHWLQGLGGGGAALYAGVFAVTSGLGLLPTYAQSFLGGWAFGPVLGTGLALAGFVAGSLLSRLVAGPMARDRVEGALRRHPRAQAVRDALVGRGALHTLGIVTLVRLPPNSPFALTNLVLTATGVPLWIYVVGTAVGMLPRTAITVWLGSQVQGELAEASRPKWLVFVGLGLTVAVVMVLSQLGQRAIDAAMRRAAGSGASSAPRA